MQSMSGGRVREQGVEALLQGVGCIEDRDHNVVVVLLGGHLRSSCGELGPKIASERGSKSGRVANCRETARGRLVRAPLVGQHARTREARFGDDPLVAVDREQTRHGIQRCRRRGAGGDEVHVIDRNGLRLFEASPALADAPHAQRGWHCIERLDQAARQVLLRKEANCGEVPGNARPELVEIELLLVKRVAVIGDVRVGELVRRRDQQDPVRAQDAVRLGQQRILLDHMLEDLECDHDVRAARGKRQPLRACDQIAQVGGGSRVAMTCVAHRLRVNVDSDDRCRGACEKVRAVALAAAYVHYMLAGGNGLSKEVARKVLVCNSGPALAGNIPFAGELHSAPSVACAEYSRADRRKKASPRPPSARITAGEAAKTGHSLGILKRPCAWA